MLVCDPVVLVGPIAEVCVLARQPAHVLLIEQAKYPAGPGAGEGHRAYISSKPEARSSIPSCRY